MSLEASGSKPKILLDQTQHFGANETIITIFRGRFTKVLT